MTKKFKLHDSVLYRFIQIFQEAMMMGIDCSDLFRQVELVSSKDDEQCLTLSDEYKGVVNDFHEQSLRRIDELVAQQNKMVADDEDFVTVSAYKSVDPNSN